MSGIGDVLNSEKILFDVIMLSASIELVAMHCFHCKINAVLTFDQDVFEYSLKI